MNDEGSGPYSEQTEPIKCEDKIGMAFLLKAKTGLWVSEEERPSFVLAPEETIALKNSKVKVTAEFKGVPTPEVKWFKVRGQFI